MTNQNDRHIVSIVITIVMLLTCFTVTLANAADSETRPNILLITADDMGYTDIASFGGEIRTPNLDALALTGVRLTNFHVGPACSQTRTMLMSGTYTEVGAITEGRNRHLTEKIVALPQLMKDAGYHTYMSGKWHLGGTENQHPGVHGFESSFVLNGGASEHFYFGRNMEVGRYLENGEPVAFPEGAYTTELYTDKMLEYLEANEGDSVPFFAWYTPTSPHWPMQVPDDYLHRYDGAYDTGYDDLLRKRVQRAEEMGVLQNGFTLKNYPRTGDWNALSDEEKRIEARTMEIYAAMVENFDFHVGRLISYLRKSGQYENTIIIFSSDNGSDSSNRDTSFEVDNSLENIGRANSYVAISAWADAHTAPFKWHKGTQAEGGIRVPAFIHYGSLTNKSGIDNRFITIMDVMPTFLELAESKRPETSYKGRAILPVPGVSFASLIHGDETVQEHHAGDKSVWYSQALYQQEWKLARPGRDEDSQDWLLFNLRKDPSETTNLANEYPELLAEMVSEWTRIGEQAGASLDTNNAPNEQTGGARGEAN